MTVVEEDGGQIVCQYIYNNKYKQEVVEISGLLTLSECIIKHTEAQEILRNAAVNEAETKRVVDETKERMLRQKEKKLDRKR